MSEAARPFESMGDAVMANIAGQRDAQEVLASLRNGCAPIDLLLEEFDRVAAVGNAEHRRSFARTLQKALERAT